jgi:hypothetical protein
MSVDVAVFFEKTEWWIELCVGGEPYMHAYALLWQSERVLVVGTDGSEALG